MTRITYPASAPETARKPDWRATAACREEAADLFFPDGTTGHWLLQIEEAKAVCRRCPVSEQCLDFALNIGAHDGIFGGLTADERTTHRRNSLRRERTNPIPTVDPDTPAASLEEAFGRRSAAGQKGHRVWYGAPKFKWQGNTYNALHVSFYLAHGRAPEGPIRRSCTNRSCYEGAHLTDGRLRDEGALCGTRRGYQRHKKHGEKACDPCRRANTAADNRLRRTGTTKVAV